MSTVVGNNGLCRTYNFSGLITPEDNQNAISIVKNIIDAGHYFTNSPKFQTKENIFGRPEPVWLKYRMTFLTSLFLYLGQEVRVGNMMAWCFMTNNATQENRDAYWHHHNKHSGRSMSGIYYLHIPDDVKDRSTCGTEMAPNGPENDGKFFIGPNDYTWNIYPSSVWHRPGIVQSDQYRFVLAVDIDVDI